MDDTRDQIETILAGAGGHVDRSSGAIVPPVHPSTTFVRDTDYALVGDHIYGRYGSPTVDLVQQLAARLDGGEDALAFSSGLAAAAALFETVEAGQHIVVPSVMYHGTQDWLLRISQRRGIGLTFYDALDPQGLSGALRSGETAVVWIESLLNPTWDVVDIAATADAAHAAGSLLVVDSTVAPPVTSRPIELGADLVFHSATKYYNGHTDVAAGLLITAERDERWAELQTIRKLSGAILGPFEAWLLIRGARTLHLRYERASSNALALAEALTGHPGVEQVLYPGLPAHPGHDVAKRQMTGGFGGMLSVLVSGGDEEAMAVANRLRLFASATSLGGVESLVEHRRSVEGPDSDVAGNLLRVSVGIEAAADLIADFQQALAAG